MTVFGDAMADILGDEDVTIAASFRHPPYAWESVRVTREQPTDAFGNARAGSLHVTILAAAVTDTPQPGDEVMIGTTVYVVKDTERDSLGLSWLLTLADHN